MKNDRVKKGNVLISGKVKIVGDNEEVVGKKKVQAQGTVVLRCTKQYEKKRKKTVIEREYSGRSRTVYQWNIGKKHLFFYNPLKSLETYEKYDIIREGGCLCPFISLRFPVSRWKKTFLEVTEKKETYSRQEAQKDLEAEYEYYLQQMGDEGCFDITGDLTVQEKQNFFVGRADITYSRQQTCYDR
jgi:similar to stage IV sporulation protein